MSNAATEDELEVYQHRAFRAEQENLELKERLAGNARIVERLAEVVESSKGTVTAEALDNISGLLVNLKAESRPDPRKGTGRTTALILRLIASAMLSPGKSVTFLDHAPNVAAAPTVRRIERIIERLGLRNMEFMSHDPIRLRCTFAANQSAEKVTEVVGTATPPRSAIDEDLVSHDEVIRQLTVFVTASREIINAKNDLDGLNDLRIDLANRFNELAEQDYLPTADATIEGFALRVRRLRGVINEAFSTRLRKLTRKQKREETENAK